MSGFTEHISRTAPEYIALLGLLLVALIANMPTPQVMQKLIGEGWAFVLYKWVYDSLQAFMAARSPQAHIVTTQETPGASIKQDATFPANPTPTK